MWLVDELLLMDGGELEETVAALVMISGEMIVVWWVACVVGVVAVWTP